MTKRHWTEIVRLNASGVITREEMIDQLGNYLVEDVSQLPAIIEAINDMNNDYLSECGKELYRVNSQRFEEYQARNKVD